MPNAEDVIKQIKQIDDNQELNKIKEYIESIDNNLKKIVLSELSDKIFKIPYYQRGYRWSKENIKLLLDDLKEFLDDNSEGNTRYILQPLAIAKTENENEFEVIDGQQRLTTLYLIYKYLAEDQNPKWYKLKYETEQEDSNNKDVKKMSELLKNKIVPYTDADDDGKREDSINVFYVRQAYTAITEWFSKNKDYKELIRSLITETDNPKKKAIMFLWFEVDYNSRHSAFQNLNSGKIQLTNSDLIKALFLSESSGVSNKEEVAVQFEQMERQFAVDKFWFMFNARNVNTLKGQSRIDYIFNLAINMMNYSSEKNKTLEISDSAYQLEPRKAFFYMTSNKTKTLDDQWKEIRFYYLILMEFYENPYYFHYIGYLIWNDCNSVDSKIELIIELIKDYTTKNKSVFLEDLKEKIFNSLKCNSDKRFASLDSKEKIEKYVYPDGDKDENVIKSRKELLKIFMLHNIQTILCRYELLKNYKTLYANYEYFPFELYHAQTWHIEHIDSQTENKISTIEERKDWINGINIDYPEYRSSADWKKFKDENKNFFDKCPNNEKFDYLVEILSGKSEEKDDTETINDIFAKFYSNFINWYNNKIKLLNESDDETNGNLKPIQNIHGIGNLVLLDQHTNTSYQNALFIRKRRIILMTSGLMNKSDEQYCEKIENVFVPICTRDIFLKSYNKSSNYTINYWSKEDYNAYEEDIVAKLEPFLCKKSN